MSDDRSLSEDRFVGTWPTTVTPGSKDFHVMNTQGSLDPAVLGTSIFILYTNSDADQIVQEVKIQHRGVETLQCIHHKGVKTSQCIHQEGVVLHIGESFNEFFRVYHTEIIIHKIDLKFMFKKKIEPNELNVINTPWSRLQI
jgi:hypothetical protein